MFESTTQNRTRLAYQTAHAARGQALHDILNWMFGRHT